MAIGQSDGSIILSTKVDTSGINQGASSIKGIIGKLGGMMAAAFSVKMIANFAKETKNLYKIQMQNEVKLATVMRQRINATNEQIQKVMDLASAEQQLGIIGDEVQLAGLQQLATFARQQETIESLLPAMNNLIAQQYGFEASTESARNVANLMGKVLQGQTGALTRVGITFTEAQEQVLKYGNESERAATLAQVITDNVGEMNKALANTDIGRQQQLSNTIGDIKEQFGEAITQIEFFFLPLLQKLAEVLSSIAVIFKSATNSIFNSGKESESEWKSIENNSNKTAGNIEEQVENQKDLNKEMKKTLAGFDDIQILSSQTADEAIEGLDAQVQGGGGAFTSDASLDGSPIEEEINKTFLKIVGTVSKGMMVLGCILLVTGNIGWGIGLIIAGAIASEYAEAQVGDGSSLKELLDTITNVLIIAGIVAIVLGILLCMAQMWGKGIGLIITGAISVASSIAVNWNSIKEKLQGSFGKWLAIGGVVAIILGIILCCTPALPLGIGLIVLGAAALVTPIVVNWNYIVKEVEKVFKDFGWLIAILGAALIVIGIICCCTGFGIGAGIAMILMGAAYIVTAVVVNWNSIVTTVQQIFKDFGGIIAAAGAALIVIGIILCCTGVGIGIGIGLILAGALAIAGTVIVNWDAIVGWVKNAWDAVKEFWNKHIAPIFTAEWWLNLGKTCINGLIAGFESGINGIIWAFESMINWVVDGLNKLSFDIPDWVPAIGGETWGMNIPKASFGRVSIPRLAQGAVIPANREFLAILGDQKHGTNIEAPLQTIVDAFNIALAQNGSAVGGNTEVVLEIDGREFGRAVVEQGNKESRRIGTRLVIA